MSSSSKLLDMFLAEQIKLINPPTKTRKANKALINPENKVINENDLEMTYNMILEKRPSNKKVIKFLQNCIDKIIEDDD